MRPQTAIRNRQDFCKPLLGAFTSLTFMLLAGCASLPQQPPVSNSDLTWVLAGADTAAPTGGAALEDAATLMQVTDEMRQFARNATQDQPNVAEKTKALAKALGDAGLHLRYDANATLSAEQAFAQRRANCLTYTMLFVALAREVGMPAKFNEVDIPPIWDLGNDTTTLLYKHVNARINLNLSSFVIVDVNGDQYDSHFVQHNISDDEALAQFFNNRAVEERLQQRHADALRHQLRALQLSPDAAYLWTNLASLYLQTGNTRAARIAVSHALALDAGNMVGYDTAAQVYERLGERATASHYRELAQHFLDQNPYYHYQLALTALREGNNHRAYSEAHRAIQLNASDARFFFLIAVVLNNLGESNLAEKSMLAAISLTDDAGQQARYRSKFAQLNKHG